MYGEIPEAEMTTATEDKHQIEIIEKYEVRCITTIKIKELSTQYAVVDLTDKEDIPDIPAEVFN